MALRALSLETLEQLDGGKIAESLARHLQRASMDCYDRPGDSKPRTVSLKIALAPVLDVESGACTEVKAQIHIESKVPAHRTRVLSLGLKPNGALLFNPDSLDNVDQTTLLNDEE